MSYRAEDGDQARFEQSDYVDCGDSNSLNFSNSMSLEAWVQVTRHSKDSPCFIAASGGEVSKEVKGYWLGLVAAAASA